MLARRWSDLRILRNRLAHLATGANVAPAGRAGRHNAKTRHKRCGLSEQRSTRKRSRWLIALAGAVILVVVLVKTTSVYHVASASMEPTLHCAGAPGCKSTRSDRVVVSALPYLLGSVSRGDIVLIGKSGRSKHCARRGPLLKRVVAVGGDEVYQSGRRFDVAPRGMGRPTIASLARFNLIRVPRDHVFVVGDSTGSCDSRDFGPVADADVRGKVVLVYSAPYGIHVP